MIPPIKPSEVAEKMIFPDEVMSAFNELIAAGFDGRQSVVKQDAVIKLIGEKNPKFTPALVFASNWLNVEPVYRLHGWIVVYDKPAYNETYPATFTFKVGQK